MNMSWLNWRPRLAYGQSIEILLLSGLTLGLAYLARPDDPLALTGGFPWAWLAPVLFALRYGILSGLVSAAILLTGWLFISHGGIPPQPLPKNTLFGGLILTMLCGEFNGLWNNRLRRQTELNHYLDQRLEELTLQHYLLKLSHDRLEQNLISQPYTLRGALAELRELSLQPSNGRLAGAVEFMALLGTHCQLSTAGIYPASGERLDVEPVATCGEPGPLHPDDPLVRHALETRTLVHVNLDADLDEAPSRYLAVAPIYRDDALCGLLAVTHMPFLAFHHDTLQMLTALLSCYADILANRDARHRDAPPEFVRNLLRLARVQADSGIASHLVVLGFADTPLGHEIRRRLAKSRRELDFYWLRDEPTPRLIALLPLTNEEGLRGYLARVNAWLDAEYGKDCGELGIAFHGEPLKVDNPLAQLDTFIDHAD